MGTFIEDKLTTVEAKKMVITLYRAWGDFHGQPPHIESLACCLAQMALETGHMQLCHCWNVGNIKRKGEQDSCDWTMFRCGEIINGRQYMFDPPHRQTHFRAYSCLEEGMADYIRFLAFRERYKMAWLQVHLGNPDRMSRKLGEAGYYTADIDLYTKHVVSLYSRYLNIVQLHLEPELLTKDEHERLSAAVSMSLDAIAREVIEEMRDEENEAHEQA